MKFILLLLLLILVYIKYGESIRCDLGVPQENTIEKLKYDVMCKYDKSLRPNNQHDIKNKISIIANVKEFDIDEELQKMRLIIRMEISWIDNHFSWKTEDYDNIDVIREYSNDIWMPEISATSCDSSQVQNSCRKNKRCTITNYGKVVCPYVSTYFAYCSGDFTYWPFDRQYCIFNMDSSDTIDYNMNATKIYFQYHKKDSKWMLKHSEIIRRQFTTTEYSLPFLTFNFKIERHSTYEFSLILCPVFVMIILNLIGFLLDFECPDRFILLIANEILHFLLIQQVFLYVPKNGEFAPKIVLFVRDSTILTGVLLLETVIVRSITRLNYSLPHSIDFLTKFSFTHLIEKCFTFNNYSNDGETNNTNNTDLLNENIVLVEDSSRQTKSKINLKWKFIGILFDRLFFFIYIIIYIVMCCTLIPTDYKEISF